MQTLANPHARRAGVLLHISSLPNGDFGDDAFRFVDFLAQTQATIWQILPLNMPHFDGSPYQCLSAHAGNPAFISCAHLIGLDLLTGADINTLQANKHALLSLAYQNYKSHKNAVLQQQFARFRKQNAGWLNDFALFLVLRKKYNQTSWITWPQAFKNHQAAALANLKAEHKQEIAEIKFTQFLFFHQWQALKNYANSRGIAMFGDMPIFVAFDSADVWSQPQMFKLDADKNMQVVAGVPPDYFSETGQRWGNPHYNWPAMQADGFRWWLARMRTQSKLFDMLRIDHFRGLEAAWEIPAADDDAVKGSWMLAPGDALLKTLTKRFKNMQLIAEDLGIITPEVDALRQKYQLPSMKILQFAFGGDADNPYLPDNIEPNSVVYTGTHDNDTTLGWYLQLDDETKKNLHEILLQDELQQDVLQLDAVKMQNLQANIPNHLIEMALTSNANIAIIPMQDVLHLDSRHRMNIPGTMVGNWQWQFNWSQLTETHSANIKNMIKTSNRVLEWQPIQH
jgi:4-alpha-glucanotransferase